MSLRVVGSSVATCLSSATPAGAVRGSEGRAGGGGAQLWSSSTSVDVKRRFVVGITTGELRVQKALFPLEWELRRAIFGATNNLGLSFVTKVSIDGFDEELTGTDEHRGTKGWVALFSVVVEMNFSHQEHLLAAGPDFGA